MNPALPALLVLFAAGHAAAQVPMTSGPQKQLEGNSAEIKYGMTLEAPRHKDYCQASAWVEYLQKNTMASVNGAIKNEDCGPSSGEYTISVRFKDENGDVQNVEYVEQWQRDDDQELLFEGEYFMGENVDLIGVRARKLECLCTEDSADAADKGENE